MTIMQKKSQLSIETMIIYGLVILVSLSVLGMLIYFDILDLGAYLPDTCNLGGTGNLKCEEMQFSGNILELGIRNTGQRPIESLTISATDETSVHFSGSLTGIGEVDGNPIAFANSLGPGEIASVKITLTSGTAQAGKLLRGSLITEFKFKDGVVTQKSSGNIRIKAS
jgi:hypothetical protein